MATIRDVASLVGVSPTTVSLIINGKAEERKISDATQKKVRKAMRELGYHPDLAARRLRNNAKKLPVIAFFWPLDYRISILASFLNALEREFKALDFNCELVVQTFENDKLNQFDPMTLKYNFNAAIVGACSADDIRYLESIEPQFPLVLFNRTSEHFSTICTDNQAIGCLAAEQLSKKGYRQASMIATQYSYVATGLRAKSFLSACSRLGIDIRTEHIIKGDTSIEGGYRCGLKYAAISDAPKVIFCDSDAMAVGALRAFYEKGIRVPEEVQILAIAMMEPEFTRYCIPSLTTIEMPNREISHLAATLLCSRLKNNDLTAEHISVPASIIFRESFPEP